MAYAFPVVIATTDLPIAPDPPPTLHQLIEIHGLPDAPQSRVCELTGVPLYLPRLFSRICIYQSGPPADSIALPWPLCYDARLPWGQLRELHEWSNMVFQ